METLELLKKVLGSSTNDLSMTEQERDDWTEAYEELMNKTPFDMISDLGDRVEELQGEVRKLKQHIHADGKVCIPMKQ